MPINKPSCEILQRRTVFKGDIIFHQGDMGSAAYVIQSGHVEVFIREEGREIIIATLGPGEVIGEMAALFDGQRTASVRALTQCTLVVMPKDKINQQLALAPSGVRAMMKILGDRVKRTNARVVTGKA